MEQFKLREDGFKEMKKTTLIKTIPTMLFALSVGIAISYFNSKDHENDWIVFPIMIVFVLVLLVFSMRRAVRKQQQLFETYILTVDNGFVRREMFNTPPITLSKDEIQNITKNKDGGFVIRGNSSVNVIGIPSQMKDYQRLEVLLTEIKPFSTTDNKPLLQRYNKLVALLTMLLMGAVYIGQNAILVGVSGILLLALMIYSLFETQRSKNIDNTTKRSMWIVLIVIFSIMGVMYVKLTS